MNIPNTMMRNAISRRGGMRSDGARGAAAIIAGGAVVALAMICSDAHSRARGPRRRNYCGWIIVGESRSASLSASAAPSRVSTVA